MIPNATSSLILVAVKINRQLRVLQVRSIERRQLIIDGYEQTVHSAHAQNIILHYICKTPLLYVADTIQLKQTKEISMSTYCL